MWILSDCGIFGMHDFVLIRCNEGKLMFTINGYRIRGGKEDGVVITSYGKDDKGEQEMVNDFNKICDSFINNKICVDLRKYYGEIKSI